MRRLSFPSFSFHHSFIHIHCSCHFSRHLQQSRPTRCFLTKPPSPTPLRRSNLCPSLCSFPLFFCVVSLIVVPCIKWYCQVWASTRTCSSIFSQRKYRWAPWTGVPIPKRMLNTNSQIEKINNKRENNHVAEHSTGRCVDCRFLPFLFHHSFIHIRCSRFVKRCLKQSRSPGRFLEKPLSSPTPLRRSNLPSSWCSFRVFFCLVWLVVVY